jgi:hypothetical protein
MRRRYTSVVSVGEDREPLLFRDAVLKSAGFAVFTTDNENEALARISRGDCGVLLVCYSAPLPMKRHLAVPYRKRCHGDKIIAVSNQRVDTLEIADSFVHGIDGQRFSSRQFVGC